MSAININWNIGFLQCRCNTKF